MEQGKSLSKDPVIAEIMNGITFRFMNTSMPGTMNSTTDIQSNIIALDVANTQFAHDTPFMRMEFLRTPRMSTLAIAYIINRLVNKMPADQIYLNVGVWCGWTFFAGILGNEDKYCVGVDNFSEFPNIDSRGIFKQQYDLFKNVNSHFFEMDYLEYFRKIHKESIGVYYYDGDHGYEHQFKALKVASPFLADGAYVLVDDTNASDPYNASIDFVRQNSDAFEVVLDQKTFSNSHPTFWDGLLILKKKGSAV